MSHCWIYKFVCVCVCVERAVMSVAQRFTLSLLVSFWLPPVVSMLSLATYISENWQMSQCPPRYLCLTPSVGLPIGTFHRRHSSSFFLSFCPDSFPTISVEILIPLLLRSELSLKPRWLAHDLHTHCASGEDTEMHGNKVQGASDEHNKVWTDLRW